MAVEQGSRTACGDAALHQVEAYIHRHRLLPATARILVAVSGGVDSVVLLEMLRRMGHWPLAIAHCNFHLRGPASDRDAAFVQQLAHADRLPLFLQEWDTRHYCHEHGLSLEEGARALRYAWFEQLLDAHGFTHLAVAHQATDQAETMLLNLARGAGPLGMRGMPRARGRMVRPLLCLTRHDVEAWARAQGLHWVEDATNGDVAIRRNLVRHQVLPPLQQINPQAVKHMALASEHLMDLLDIVDHMARAQFGQWDRPLLGTEGPWPYTVADDRLPLYRVWLRQRLASLGFPASVGAALIHGMEHPRVGRRVEGPRATACFTQEGLSLVPPEVPRPDQVPLPVPGCAEAHGLRFTAHTEACPPFADAVALKRWASRGRWCVLLDADSCQEPLAIRRWHAGDRLRPLGMHGLKLVSDILTDGKLRADRRTGWPVVVCGALPVWVVGYRQEADHALRLDSTMAVAIQCAPINE